MTSAIGNPMMIASTINLRAQFGISKIGKTCVVTWTNSQPTIAPLQLGEEVAVVHCFALTCQSLFNIWDLYDTALCLRIVRIFYHGYVQFFLAFAEGDVCRTITCGDFEDVQKLALWR